MELFKLLNEPAEMPPAGSYMNFNLHWAAYNAFSRLADDGVFITKAEINVLNFAAGLIENRYPELKLTNEFRKKEESILKASQKLIKLLEDRPFDAWAVWGDSKTHEPDYYLDKEDTIETLKFLKESTREQIKFTNFTIKNSKLKNKNRVLRDRFLHWSLLRDFWRSALKRKVQKSYDPVSEKHTGPFIRFIMIMSERAPFADDITEDSVANWIKTHGDKFDVGEDIAMMLKEYRNLEKENIS